MCVGSKTARKKLAKEQQQQKKQLVVSKVEQVLLAKTPAPAKVRADVVVWRVVRRKELLIV